MPKIPWPKGKAPTAKPFKMPAAEDNANGADALKTPAATSTLANKAGSYLTNKKTKTNILDAATDY